MPRSSGGAVSAMSTDSRPCENPMCSPQHDTDCDADKPRGQRHDEISRNEQEQTERQNVRRLPLSESTPQDRTDSA